jgi:serine phosphatase RsbU (regulator of sigma subunit)
MAQLDAESRTLRLLNCGCPYPLHYRARDGQISELKSESYPLGIRLDTDYAPLDVSLEPGDRIIFHSDGVIEAKNWEDELFGDERLIATLNQGCKENLNAEALLDQVVNKVRAFTGEAPQGDDQTLVILAVD